jgi:hypothetical protein
MSRRRPTRLGSEPLTGAARRRSRASDLQQQGVGAWFERFPGRRARVAGADSLVARHAASLPKGHPAAGGRPPAGGCRAFRRLHERVRFPSLDSRVRVAGARPGSAGEPGRTLPRRVGLAAGLPHRSRPSGDHPSSRSTSREEAHVAGYGAFPGPVVCRAVGPEDQHSPAKAGRLRWTSETALGAKTLVPSVGRGGLAAGSLRGNRDRSPQETTEVLGLGRIDESRTLLHKLPGALR